MIGARHFSLREKMAIAFSIIVVLVSALLTLDSTLRIVLRQDVLLSLVESSSDKTDTLIIYLPGIMSPSFEGAGDMVDVWLEYGDVLMVDYGDESFLIDPLVNALSDFTKDEIYLYDKLVVIGSSMGGLAAHDFIVDVAEHLEAVELELVLLDSPSGGSDILSRYKDITRFLYPGPILNSLDLVSSNHVYDYELSFFADQVRYVVEHEGLQLSELSDVVSQIIYVSCIEDNRTIDSGASSSWASAAGVVPFVEMSAESPHVFLYGRPDVWDPIFRQILGG